jgi:hypothetical protein
MGNVVTHAVKNPNGYFNIKIRQEDNPEQEGEDSPGDYYKVKKNPRLPDLPFLMATPSEDKQYYYKNKDVFEQMFKQESPDGYLQQMYFLDKYIGSYPDATLDELFDKENNNRMLKDLSLSCRWSMVNQRFHRLKTIRLGVMTLNHVMNFFEDIAALINKHLFLCPRLLLRHRPRLMPILVRI